LAWSLGRRYFGPKVLVPGTLGDVFLLAPPTRISAASMVRSGVASSTRIDQSWPVKPGDVHRSHGYHLCVIEIGDDPTRYLNAYRAAFVESCMILLDAADVSPILWRLRGLGDPLGYRAAHVARDAQDRLDPALSEEERFAGASVMHLAQRARRLVVPSGGSAGVLRALGSRTPVDVIPQGPDATDRLSTAILGALALVKDPAHGALELWACALADMGVVDTGTNDLPGLSYLRAMESFKGTPSNLHRRA
jgi:hypothetical protein